MMLPPSFFNDLPLASKISADDNSVYHKSKRQTQLVMAIYVNVINVIDYGFALKIVLIRWVDAQDMLFVRMNCFGSFIAGGSGDPPRRIVGASCRSALRFNAIRASCRSALRG